MPSYFCSKAVINLHLCKWIIFVCRLSAEPSENNRQSLLRLDEKVEQEAHAQQQHKSPSDVILNTRNQIDIPPLIQNKVPPPLKNSILSQKVLELQTETQNSDVVHLKSEKKGNAAIKNSKKAESKSVSSSENIKCTTYTCPVCKKVLMKKGLFKTHLETHKTDHKYACEICLRV